MSSPTNFDFSDTETDAQHLVKKPRYLLNYNVHEEITQVAMENGESDDSDAEVIDEDDKDEEFFDFIVDERDEGYESDPDTWSDFDDDEDNDDDDANAGAPFTVAGVANAGARSNIAGVANAGAPFTIAGAANADALSTIAGAAKIPLYGKDGSIVDYAYVDEEDFERVMQWKWWKTRQGYAQGIVNGVVVYLHRYVTETKSGNMMIDHKNQIKLDNRKANLQLATALQNNLNRAKVMTEMTTSPYKGVYKRVLPSGKVRWIARICHRHLGSFRTEHEAAHMYNLEFMALSGRTDAPNNVLPVELNPIGKKGPADLPRGVTICKGGFSARIDGKAVYFDDKEEAIAARQAYEDELEKKRRAEVFSRPIAEDEDGNAIITLSNGMKSKVDHDIWHEASLYTWRYVKGYAYAIIGGLAVSLHRFAKGLGSPNEHTLPVVDHKNGDRRDNRRENLHETTWSFNAFNRRKKEGAQSEYYGVRTLPNGTFVAALRYQGVQYYLGTYRVAKHAAYAYDCKSELIYGVRRNGIELPGYKFVNDRVLPEGSKPKEKTSNYTGVHLNERGTWTASRSQGSKTLYFGIYATQEEAAYAVDSWSAEQKRPRPNGMESLDGFVWNSEKKRVEPAVLHRLLEAENQDFIGVFRGKRVSPPSYSAGYNGTNLGTYRYKLLAAFAYDTRYHKAHPTRPRPNGIESVEGYKVLPNGKVVEEGMDKYKATRKKIQCSEKRAFGAPTLQTLTMKYFLPRVIE